MVRNKIKNTSNNNEATLLKLGRDVAPYQIHQDGTRFDVAMATFSVAVSFVFKIKYHHLELHGKKILCLTTVRTCTNDDVISD